ncbi:TPA: hypothetical protein KDX74_003524 [Vibrio parahaemolyticus]|uniref:hypothetical protein n=1 Tax=Vibrio parahaemolyticus TaxID=670 RepID=UPI001122E82F|nr:hypothetical protein [Vibrio parahaemolyticus]EJG0650528.1 hypothetical protein [Vibrio parahaemolyticus]MCI9705017.1 hypothetical protein [Vibrio parahaemolyticus]MDF4636542.1 hypothetical protein [Vibrio parahaemolyticus]MDF5483061.1 hypothetical protein [Vibrio parahaemolyticus]MDG2622644.1 hypothetical protein [Vibrio parahaemolyticus]
MKKSIILLGLTSLFASSVFAGGTFGGNPGDISKMKELLEQEWNGKAGIQNTSAYGVIVQWKADVCGTLNGHVTDKTQCGLDTPKGKAQ